MGTANYCFSDDEKARRLRFYKSAKDRAGSCATTTLACAGFALMCSAQQLISWLANDAPRGIGGGVGLLFYFLPGPWVGCLCPDRGCVGDEDSFADFILPPVSCGTVNTRDGDSNTFTSKSEDCCDENNEITSHNTVTNFGCCFLTAGHDAAGAGAGVYVKPPLHG